MTFADISINVWKLIIIIIYFSFLLLSSNVPLRIDKCTTRCRPTCTPGWEPLLWVLEKRTSFPLSYLKAAARELLGMTATSTPSQRVFSHAGEFHSAKRANLDVRTFAIFMLMTMRMNPHLGMNWTWIEVAFIWVNVIRIRTLVQFLVFAYPLILIFI